MKREFRRWEKWECFRAGFYAASGPAGMPREACEEAYRQVLGNSEAFRKAAYRVLTAWPNSCAHFLSNESINRVAWLGQASVCVTTGVPSKYKYAFLLLTQNQQEEANGVARRAIRWWEDNAGKRQALFANMEKS